MTRSKTQQTLDVLLDGIDSNVVYCPDNIEVGQLFIRSIGADSRKAVTGGLFVAVEGLGSDGHHFIDKAVLHGSVAIICAKGRVTREQAEVFGVTVVEVEDTLETYAHIAACFYENPAEKLCCIGITGTNGKTTVTYLLEQVLLNMGKTVGVIGTVNNRYTGRDGMSKIIPTVFTTPEPVLLQSLLVEMVEAGVDYVVMEVSSHALVQARVGAITFQVAAFTNLTRDHLDYHGSMGDYFEAKKRLFSRYLQSDGFAVLPAADVLGDEGEVGHAGSLHNLCKRSCNNILYWGEGEVADVRLLDYSFGLRSTDMQIASGGERYSISSPLVGRYNVDNLLTVIAIGKALGLSESEMCVGLGESASAPGRLERASSGDNWDSKGPVVFVDFAHTPDALSKVLEAVEALPHKELYCIFGCGGDRDQGKRPLMGKIAASCSHVSIVTDDNPRTEEPNQIVEQILVGVEQAGCEVKNIAWLSNRHELSQGCVVVRDRQKAIEFAIRSASAEDIVVIAGKGHEPYQHTIDGKRYFDDCQEAKNVLSSWTVELLAEATFGDVIQPSQESNLLGVVHTDSRKKEADGVFVALRGDTHDGHDYVVQAVENGATCLIVESEVVLSQNLHATQVLVGDTTKALGDLAAFRRSRLSGTEERVVVGLTGSCGKTTVKEMIASILSKKWPEGEKYPENSVLKTQGNFNNLIGLPLSLLPLEVKHRAAVLEMGMNISGELQRLGTIADPDVSCITNVYSAHLEGLGTIEGVAKAKEELFQATGEQSKLVINLDDELIAEMAPRYEQAKITFAVNKSNHDIMPDLWATDIFHDKNGEINFLLHHLNEQVEIKLHIPGEHNVSNALCASAVGLAVGANVTQIAEGLAAFRAPDKRMQMVSGLAGVTILNDTYNANPASMSAGLKTLKQMTTERSAAIVGDMLELGVTSSEAHYSIGALISQLDLGYVAVVGNFKEDVKRGAVEAGFEKENICTFKEKEMATAWIKELADKKKLGQGDMLLVKASRGLRFETIVAQLSTNE